MGSLKPHRIWRTSNNMTLEKTACYLFHAILLYSGLHKTESLQHISTTLKDVTTPMTTVPVTPTLNPTDGSSAGSWCIATQSAPHVALQDALDYACGRGGADCSEIQPGGTCFVPISVRDHASYAFNGYYQKNPTPSSCSFGGCAVTTSIDPSYEACQYPSTSTASSVLNTTNSMGSHVFGATSGPTTPPSSSAPTISARFHYFQHVFIPFIIAISSFISKKGLCR